MLVIAEKCCITISMGHVLCATSALMYAILQAGILYTSTKPLQLCGAPFLLLQRTVLISTEVVVVGCLDRFLAYLAALEPQVHTISQ